MDPGTKLGHYEILAPLGEGGMGQVYRARDTTLDRDVAIKVLPEDFASDANRLARFEREAKLLASLNHPNIATIFGFEESDGVRFIAMELVEGQSLAERIEASGRMEVDEALEIARRIALALEAAHEAGVIHRDLKPANVQVSPDGTVKVLDFGLAKAYEAGVTQPSSDLSHSPTMMAATGTGVIMGTAPYMSPEQARGTPVDKRSDIWSFGCVLYEMLTGERTFDGDTVSDTMAAILKESPEWDALPPDTPSGIRRLLERCLRKSPAERLQHMGDARIEIIDSATEPHHAAQTMPSRLPRVAAGVAASGVENENTVDGPVSTPPGSVTADLQRDHGRTSASLAPAMRSVLLVLLFGVLSACSQPASQSLPVAATPPPGSEYEGAAFEFEAISDDVYLAVETGNLGAWCNAVVIVNDNDVLLVESHVSPAAAWALLRELKEITDKPVRYVVNTHFHFDHLHGNQIYGDDVEIIGHEFTRQKVLSGDSNRGRTLDYFAGFVPGRIEELEAELAAGEEPDRTAELRHELAVLRNMRLAMDDVVPTPPNLTLTDRMTLHRGGREIQLMFLGRGHTAGDVVVYLPGEKILVTGDLLTAGLPWMGDGYPLEWAETLERFKALDVDVMLPAHGRAIRDFERIDRWQAYLSDFWTITAAMHRQGVSAEEAASRVDLRSHAGAHPRLAEIGAELLEVERVYELLDGELFDGGE